MAGLMVLVSSLAAGAFGKRVAIEHVEFQKQKVAWGPGGLPGSVRAALPLRPAVIPQASVPGRISMQEVGNPGKYPAEDAEMRLSQRLDTSPKVWMSADNDQDGATLPEPDALKEAGSAEKAATLTEAEEKYKLNVQEAYDSLRGDIPQILLEGKGNEVINWDIFTDDFETDFTNVANPAALGLFAATLPNWRKKIGGKENEWGSGKEDHEVVLSELHDFINSFVEKAEVTGQDWCVEEDLDWCVQIEEESGLSPEWLRQSGNQVISSTWKTVLKLKPFIWTPDQVTYRKRQELPGGGFAPAGIVTIQAVSRFHFNDEGKVFLHSIDQFSMLFDEEDAAKKKTRW